MKYNVATGNYEAVGYLPTLADLNDETKVDTLCVKANCLAMVTAAIRWGQTQVNITLAGSMTRRVNWGGIEVASDAAAIKAPDAWDGGFVVDTVEVMGLPGYSDRKIVVRVNRTYTGPANFTIRVPAGEILMRTLKLLIVGVAIFANF